MNLSHHFTLAEFTASATARAHNIANNPTQRDIAAMVAWCENIGEPLRAHFGRPVRLTSGFRSAALSRAVGSSSKSQHCRGEAADFEIVGVSNYVVAKWISENLTFDQLILENYLRGQLNSGWVHCSFRVDRARRDVLTYSRRSYFKGLLV